MGKIKLRIEFLDMAREFFSSLPEKVQQKITYNFLKIEGGDYHLCDGLEESCGRSRCCHKWRGCPAQDEKKEDFDL